MLYSRVPLSCIFFIFWWIILWKGTQTKTFFENKKRIFVAVFSILDTAVTISILIFNTDFTWDIFDSSSIKYDNQQMGVDKTIIFILYFSCNVFIYTSYMYFAFIKKTLKFKNFKIEQSEDNNILFGKEEKEKVRNSIFRRMKTNEINIDKEDIINNQDGKYIGLEEDFYSLCFYASH